MGEVKGVISSETTRYGIKNFLVKSSWLFSTILTFQIKKKCAIVLDVERRKMKTTSNQMNDHLVFRSAFFKGLCLDSSFERKWKSKIGRISLFIHFLSPLLPVFKSHVIILVPFGRGYHAIGKYLNFYS